MITTKTKEITLPILTKNWRKQDVIAGDVFFENRVTGISSTDTGDIVLPSGLYFTPHSWQITPLTSQDIYVYECGNLYYLLNDLPALRAFNQVQGLYCQYQVARKEPKWRAEHTPHLFPTFVERAVPYMPRIEKWSFNCLKTMEIMERHKITWEVKQGNV